VPESTVVERTTQDTAEPAVSTAPAPEEHALAAISPRALGPQILSGGVAPFVAYQLARHGGMSDASALALSSVPPALAVMGEWAWRKRLNIIGAIALVGIVAGLLAMSVLHGNEMTLKMRESVVTGAFGLVCLGSLVLPGRPVMFYMGRALAGAPHADDFEEMWERPEARRAFTVITAIWGIGLVLEAGVRALLAVALPTGTFLAVTPVLGWGVIGILIYVTIAYSRSQRRNAEEAEALQNVEAAEASA